MGILDDAIRQHLELKRQHGAPEEELQRQEEEALGPARRDVAPAEPSGEDGEVELEAADEAAPDAPEEETELYEHDERAGGGARHGAGGAGERGGRRVDVPSSQTRSREPDEEPEADEPEANDEDFEGVPEPESRRRRRRPSTRRPPSRSSASEDEPEDEDDEPEDEDEPKEASRRARGHARLPPGDAGARPALVRAEAAARLRLRLGA